MWEAATTPAPAAAPAPRPFIGRTEQLHRLRGALTAPGGGVVLVTGEPGMGRTSTVRRALADLDMDRDQVVRVRPVPRGTPLLPLRPLAGPVWSLPHHPASTGSPSDPVLAVPCGRSAPAGWDDHAAVADAMARRCDGRRPVVVADDAHLLDLASLLALRDLRRRHGAVLLLTTPRSVPSPDPTDCLRFEPDARVVLLPALSPAEVADLLGAVLGCPVPEPTASALCALTSGNPRRLHSLLARPGVAARLLGLRELPLDGVFQGYSERPRGSAASRGEAVKPTGAEAAKPADAEAVPPTGAEATAPGAGGVASRAAFPAGELEVVHGVMADAWAVLDTERVVEVGDLVSGLGTDGRIAAMHAGALLLRGRPVDAERILRRAAAAAGPGTGPAARSADGPGTWQVAGSGWPVAGSTGPATGSAGATVVPAAAPAAPATGPAAGPAAVPPGEPAAGSGVGATACRVVVVRALIVAFGLGRPARARADLAAACARAGAFRGRLTAYLAWLCALDGATGEARRQLDALGPSTDPETVIMARTARAVTALATGRPVDAVRDLRRALAMVDQRHADLPWLPAHLQACLIEALLRAGRTTEASTATTRLHADPTAWRVATTLPAAFPKALPDALLAARPGALSVPLPIAQPAPYFV